MFIHDLIKIKLVDEGYLPNIPYHLISDAEMCNAFIDDSQGILRGYFIDNYPAYTSDNINAVYAYQNLILSIYCYLQLYLQYHKDNIEYKIPDWVYSYMLGSVISVNSDKRDIHDLIFPLGVDNIADDFDDACMQACFDESFKRIRQINGCESIDLPAYADVIADKLRTVHILDTDDRPKSLYSIYSNAYTISSSLFSPIVKAANQILSHPPTIFGEPLIIKSLRLKQAGG